MSATHLSAFLRIAGAGALALAVLFNRLHGRPDWTQLVLCVAGGAALVASLSSVHRRARALIDRSRRESPITLAHLRRHPALYLVYGLWFAAVSSLGELAYATYTKEISQYRVFGPQYVWLIPMGHGFWFTALGLVWLFVARRIVQRLALPTFVFACTLVAGCSWLFQVNGLHPASAVVLAAGLAVQVSRRATAHHYLISEITRRTVSGLVLGIAMIAIGVFFWPRWVEHRALAQLPPATTQTPNVLLIVLDTVRAKSMSLYGYSRSTTPSLERLAKRGVVFERAFSTSPWTLPSHGSMFTGRLPHELTGSWMSPIDGTHPTIAEELGRRGFVTAGFVANTDYGGAEFGLGRGFAHYEDHRTSVGTAMMRTSVGGELLRAMPQLQEYLGTHENFGRKSAEQVNRDFLSWLSGRPASRPYFVFLNYYDAHTPYLPPEPFARSFSAMPSRRDLFSKRLDSAWSPLDLAQLTHAYDGALAYLDHHLGLLFDELDRRGELTNTAVIVTSDHGEQFGEHNLLFHTNSLYPAVLQVPLVIVHPARVPSGSRSGAFVSLRDLAATILDLIGGTESGPFPGESLARYWQPPIEASQAAGHFVFAEAERTVEDLPEWYPSTKGRMRSVIANGIQYIKNYGDGREEVYDLSLDPEAEHDLVPSQPQLVDRFRPHVEQTP